MDHLGNSKYGAAASIKLFINPFFCCICSFLLHPHFVQLKHSVHTRVQESLFKMDDIFQFVSSKARGMAAEVKPLIFVSSFHTSDLFY
jgi:hypothetical protein